MSETFIIYLSTRCPDESGERTECVVAVDLSLIRWLVDLVTKWNSCARKQTNSNTQACEIHPFRFAIRAISFFSCNLTWNSLVRQLIFLYNTSK